MYLLSLAIRFAALCALLWLAIVDVRSRRLPTRVVLAIGALFFVDALVMHMSIRRHPCPSAPGVRRVGHLRRIVRCKNAGRRRCKARCNHFSMGRPESLAAGAYADFRDRNTCIDDQSGDTTHGSGPAFSPVRALAMFSGARGVPYGVALALGGGSYHAARFTAFDFDAIGRRPYV